MAIVITKYYTRMVQSNRRLFTVYWRAVQFPPPRVIGVYCRGNAPYMPCRAMMTTVSRYSLRAIGGYSSSEKRIRDLMRESRWTMDKLAGDEAIGGYLLRNRAFACVADEHIAKNNRRLLWRRSA